MRKHFTLIFLPLFVALQTSAEISDIYNYKNYSFNDTTYDFTNECNKIGIMCKNCAELVNCIKVGNEFTEVPLQTCNTPEETCLVNQCTKDPNPQCGASSGFTCHNTGVFPDPFDCRSYHMCVADEHNLESTTTANPETTSAGSTNDLYGQKEIQNGGMIHIPVKCDDNYGYNPVTTYCSRILTNNVCPSPPPVPICKEVGQNGAVTGTSIYYICMQIGKSLQVNLYMCPYGMKYLSGECK